MLRGKTMAEFADLIGCTQSTISRYESGQLIPSRSILILILQFADATETKVILEYLGVEPSLREDWTKAQLLESMNSFEQYLALSPQSSAASDARTSGSLPNIVEFAALAKEALVGTPEPPEALVEVLRLWLAHRENPQAPDFFRQIAAYLKVELTLSEHARGKRTHVPHKKKA